MGHQGPLGAVCLNNSLLLKAIHVSHVAYFAVYSWTTSRILHLHLHLEVVAENSCEPQFVATASSRFIQTTLATRQPIRQPTRQPTLASFSNGQCVEITWNRYCSGFHVYTASHVIIHILSRNESWVVCKPALPSCAMWQDVTRCDKMWQDVTRCAKQPISTRFSSAMSLLLCTWNLGCKDLDGQMPKEGSRMVMHKPQHCRACSSFVIVETQSHRVIDMFVHSGAWLLFLELLLAALD